MGWLWFKNLIGFKLSDAELSNVPHPYLELGTHVTIKTIQAFGLLGTVVVGPVSAAVHSDTRNLEGVQSAATRCGTWGVLVGCALGPLLTYARMRSVDNVDAAHDRCYRLRLNRGQVRVDRNSLVGAIGGGALAAHGQLGGASPTLGALLGMSAGILSTAVYNAARSK